MAEEKRFGFLFRNLLDLPDEGTSPQRYRIFRRNMIVLMAVIAVVPLFLMAAINYYLYQAVLREEMHTPLRVLVNKAKHSLEVFLAERQSMVSFVASAYSFDQLRDEKRLHRIFRALQQDFTGFIDLGVINEQGVQVSYTGPYRLKGKDYSKQGWFDQVRVEGVYVSDVFMGYRKFPHIAVAVRKVPEEGLPWILRATIDTGRFDSVIAAMGMDPQSDAFLVNREGILQTNSRFYGKVLHKLPFRVPPVSYEPNLVEMTDPQGREVVVAYSYFLRPNLILVVVKPKSAVMKAWSTLKSELLAVFLISVALIIALVFRLMDRLVTKMRESDEKRELAFREMEHSHKLSSIGRLAAGVAHEINNPLAIIGEKAGLFRDLMNLNPAFPDKERFGRLVDAILNSVDRCRTITHRLLGFARRMDVQTEILDLNSLLEEVVGFLEKEALYKNVELHLTLDRDLPRIASDRGQIQQVFLNILNNAFAAVEKGGSVAVSTFRKDNTTVGASVEDNGVGMAEETRKHIFDPFFTTKRGYGTGLGLSITYGIVKKLEGHIEVESQVGAGTKFTVYLPIKTGHSQGE